MSKIGMFRAKRIDNKEWVEGYYVKREFDDHVFNSCIYYPVDYLITQFNNGGARAIEIDPTTLEYLGNQEGENRWIPVGERLPDEEKDVYIYFDRCGGDCAVGYMAKGRGMWVVGHSKLCYHVSHWRPLPQPPTEEVK